MNFVNFLYVAQGDDIDNIVAYTSRQVLLVAEIQQPKLPNIVSMSVIESNYAICTRGAIKGGRN